MSLFIVGFIDYDLFANIRNFRNRQNLKVLNMKKDHYLRGKDSGLIVILNMNIMIDGTNVREFLDVTVPINGWAWFLILTFLPGTSVTVRKEN